MDNNIIASAILEDIIKFLRPTPDGNMGALVLEQKTIKTFKPISKIELQEYIPSFSAFNQTKQKFSIKEVNIENLNKRMNIND